MRKYVKIIYSISLILVLFMVAFFHFHEKNDEYTARENNICDIFTDYEMTSYDNESAPIGITQEYRWTLRDIPFQNGCIAFYAIHQEIEIYIDDELLYSLTKNNQNLLAKTVGCEWAKVFLHKEDSGKDIRILIHPIYHTSINNKPTIYYGNYAEICTQVVLSNLPILFIGIVAILLGLMFIAFVFLNINNQEFDKSIAMLGVFSIFAGLWKITDMPSAPLLFKDSLTLSALAIISLYMMLVPYFFFIRNQFAKERHLFWDIMCIGGSIVCIITVLLQLTGIADLRETLIVCHTMTVISVIAILIVMIFEAIRTKYSIKLKITVICCVLCLLGTIADMVIYYASGDSGNMIFCLLAFLIYVILMGYLSLNEAKQLIERGKEAKHYEHLAMHDELTGLYNRVFYSKYLSNDNLQRRNCYVVMLDVNNLKICNDTVGHDCGDRLIHNSSQLIKQAFEPKGNCIRMGGDEFCVILKNSFDNECKTYLKHFDKMLADYNKSHPEEFPIQIAYGYAHFDEKLDFDFNDTLRRADKKMYQLKNNMKERSS